MPQPIFSASDLKQLRHQLERWRQSQSGVTRLPDALWTSAATLARTHGVGTVARTLRLDYNKLKRQVSSPAQAVPVATASFVELQPRQWVSEVGAVCRIELCDRTGAKMRLELPCDPATVVGLAQAFWRRS